MAFTRFNFVSLLATALNIDADKVQESIEEIKSESGASYTWITYGLLGVRYQVGYDHTFFILNRVDEEDKVIETIVQDSFDDFEESNDVKILTHHG